VRNAPSSNCARLAATPLALGGTPVAIWLAALDNKSLQPLDTTGCRRLVVVAPHPDDETLGLGATIAQLAASGVEVQVVSVSDGGAAQPGAGLSDQTKVEFTRRRELAEATSILGTMPPVSLGLPDGRLAEHEDRLNDLLVAILQGAAPQTWCAATWRGDGHPDHEAVGRAAAAACRRTGTVLLEYPLWMWHWAAPADREVPWERARQVGVSDWALRRKCSAAQRFRSQFESSAGGPPPVLPPSVLQRLLAVSEVVFR